MESKNLVPFTMRGKEKKLSTKEVKLSKKYSFDDLKLPPKMRLIFSEEPTLKTNSSFASKPKRENEKRIESFMKRMQEDLMRRRTIEERKRILEEKSKVRLPEEDIINGFNRLIDDANRRIEARQKSEQIQTELNSRKGAKCTKRYNGEKWNEIYQERFNKYDQERKQKVETQKKANEEKEKTEKEKEIEEMKKYTIKKPNKAINLICQRLFQEGQKTPRKKKPEEHYNPQGTQKTKQKSKKKMSPTKPKVVNKEAQPKPGTAAAQPEKKAQPNPVATAVVDRLFPKSYNTNNFGTTNGSQKAKSKSPLNRTTGSHKYKKSQGSIPICNFNMQDTEDIEKIERNFFNSLTKQPQVVVTEQNDLNKIKQHRPNFLKK